MEKDIWIVKTEMITMAELMAPLETWMIRGLLVEKIITLEFLIFIHRSRTLGGTIVESKKAIKKTIELSYEIGISDQDFNRAWEKSWTWNPDREYSVNYTPGAQE